MTTDRDGNCEVARALATSKLRLVVGAALAVTSVWLIVQLAATYGQRGAHADGSSRACSSASWAEEGHPVPLPDGTFLRSPTVAVSSNALYLSGLPSPAGRHDSIAFATERTPLLVRADGEKVSLPPGPFAFINGRLIGGSKGQLHFIWGESGEKNTRMNAYPGPRIRVKSLWHAAFDPNTGWSKPRELFERAGDRDRLLWNSESADVAVTESGGVQVVVPQVNAPLLHFVLAEDAWQTDTIPVRALYATVAPGADGSTYVAYVGEDPSRGGAMNGMLIVRMDSKVRHWSMPQPILARGEHLAARPRLLVGRRGGLHLAWSQLAASRLGVDAVRYLTSEDGAASWSAPVSLDLPKQSFTKWRLALDACDVPHVFVSTWTWKDSTPVSHILYSTLRDTRWTTLVDLLPGKSAREIEVMSDGTGSLHLIASVRREGATTSPPSYDVVVSALASARSLER